MRARLLLCLLVLPALGRAQADVERSLSDAEKAGAAQSAMGAMGKAVEVVDKLIAQAKKERDALRLNCISEQKSQIEGLQKVAERSLAELKSALSDGLTDVVDHEYGKITIASTKVENYKVEAQQCIGLLAFYTGEDVEREFTDANTDTPRLDPTRPTPLEPTTFRPAPASPVR